MAKDFSILIISYNRQQDLLILCKQLIALKNWEELLEEVIIINNASSSDYSTVEEFFQVNKNFPFRYIKSIENPGVAGGRNKAINLSKAPYLIFFDNDVEISEPDILLRTREILSESWFVDNNTAILTYKIFYYSTKSWQKNAFPHKKFDEKKELTHFFTSYFIGAAHLIKKELFDQIGLYPDDFFYGMEEYDLSYRAISKGYSIAYDSRVLVYHKESPIGRIQPGKQLRMMWINKSKVAWKYLPSKYFYTTSLLWSFFYLKRSGFKIRGYISGWKEINKIRKTEARTLLNKKALLYLKSVQARLWF